MPIYDFRCSKCGKDFEYLARTLSDKPGKCPACGSKAIKKALSAFQVATAPTPCSHAPACPHAHGPGCSCCH